MNPDETLHRLARANPVPPDALQGPDDPGPRALFERIISTPQDDAGAEVRRRRRTKRRWLLVPAAALLTGAGYLAFGAVTEPLDVACVRSQPLSDSDIAVLPADGRDAAVICAEQWEPVFGEPPPAALMHCVLESGVLAILPAAPQDSCAALGLGAPDPDRNPGSDEAVGLAGALGERIRAHDCAGEAEALRAVADVLSERDLRHWSVHVADEFTDDHPCATLAYDVQRRLVIIVPSVP